jgi:hypothetical protein
LRQKPRHPFGLLGALTAKRLEVQQVAAQRIDQSFREALECAGDFTAFD